MGAVRTDRGRLALVLSPGTVGRVVQYRGFGAPEEIRTSDPQIRSLTVKQRSRRSKDRERPRRADLTRIAALDIDLRSQLSHRAPLPPRRFYAATFILLLPRRFHERNFEPDWEQQKALENNAFSRA
jgi:hypothetical protein